MKRLFLFGSVLFLAFLFVFIQRGFLQDNQDRVLPKTVIVFPNDPVDPEIAQKIADIKYFRSIGDNAKAVQILNSIPRNVATVPSLDKFETGPGPTVTPVDNTQDGKKLVSVEWATSDIPVTTGTNMERAPSTEVRYNSVNDTEMYHACESWTGSAADKIKLTRSMNHGANWYQAWLFDWTTYELSLPKVKQIHNDYLGVVMQRKYSASDSDIMMWRPKATDFTEYTSVFIDNSAATLDVRSEVASDYPEFSPGWIYVVYYRLAGASSKLMYSRSTNGGTSFETPVAIVNFTSQPPYPDSGIYYKGGELWVTYTYNNTYGKSSVALIKSGNWGATWSAPVTIWSNSILHALYPGITGATTTRAWVIYNVDYTTDWDTYYNYTTDGTNWYSGSFESSPSYTTKYPSVRYMGGSYVYAAYQYLPNQLIVQRTSYTSPTAWTSLGNIKSSTNTLTADIPALLVSTGPTGFYQASVSWIHQYSVSDYDAYFDAEWLPWSEAAALGVTPTTAFSSSGMAGGPFSPTNTDYLIQNTGGAAMSWTASKTQSWLTLSATSGSLSAGNGATLTASINSAANLLPSGLYYDTITFTNTTNGVGNTTRSVALYVNAPATLLVTPAEGLTSQGLPGGPFNPSYKVYTLKNTGVASLNWTAAKTKTWVSLSATSGTLAAGASINLTVSINSNANSLSLGAYTDTVTFTNTTNSIGNTTRSVTLTIEVKNDFNQDGKPDILWRNYGAGLGTNVVWYMNGATLMGSDWLPSVTDTNWQIGGTGDFNGDGKVDILWRNYGAGLGYNVVWYMNGATLIGSAWLPTVTDTNWQIGGTGDFNADGKVDILWRYNGAGGANTVWYMNGATLTGSAWLPTVTDTNWQIGGTGDFNADGKVDILWRYNGAGGANTVWYMNGATLTGSAWLPTVTDTNWQIGGAGDFNADGKPDILWRYNGAGGANTVWYMNGATLTGSAWLPAVADVNWRIENH